MTVVRKTYLGHNKTFGILFCNDNNNNDDDDDDDVKETMSSNACSLIFFFFYFGDQDIQLFRKRWFSYLPL